MLEYVLFHQKPYSLFVDYLQSVGVAMETSKSDDTWEVRISDDIDDDLAEKIETRYDELMDMNRALFFEENPQAKGNFSIATLVVHLKSGETTNAHIRPDLLYRVLQVIDEKELDEIVAAITTAVENPDDRSYCSKVRSDEIDFDDKT